MFSVHWNQEINMISKVKNYVVRLSNAAHSGADAVKSEYEQILREVANDYGEHAFAAILITSIMAVIVGAIMLIIGIFVTSTVSNSIPTANLTTAQNNTLNSANTNIGTAFTLLGVILIVGGAGGIIAVLLGFVGQPGMTR